ncbi:MAG TPA: DNRLRE domain-containing protein, partial [Anaerolineae bacterium]|nr:DNRLRE domain-containing protein [Anaerolineae bacterium]
MENPVTHNSTALAATVSHPPRHFLWLEAPASNATLRLYAMDTNGDSFTVNSVADNSWDEMTINSGNAPTVGSAITSYGATTADTWIEIDVTGYINGNGQYSLALTSGTTNRLRWRSREHANAPELVITTDGGSASNGQTEAAAWWGLSNANPTPTPGGRRPLKRGPSEPRWRPGDAPHPAANKSNAAPPSAALRTTGVAHIFVSRIRDMFRYLRKTLSLLSRQAQWHQLGFLFAMLSVIYLVVGCSSTSSKQLYENFEFGITLEKPRNWSVEFYERNGSIVLEAENGFWNKETARIEIYGYACVPSLLNDSESALESNIDRMHTLYNLDSVTIVQEPTIIEKKEYEMAAATILVPTMSLPEDSTKNQIGDRGPDIFQIIDMFAIRNSNNNSIMVYIYKGNSEKLNAEAQDI